MRIRRFNENEQVDIPSERIEDILSNLREFATLMSDKSKYVDSILNEFNNFKSQSKRGNDQIDDSILSLQIIKKNIDDCIDKIDTVINNLVDYNYNGRKYLYAEE